MRLLAQMNAIWSRVFSSKVCIIVPSFRHLATKVPQQPVVSICSKDNVPRKTKIDKDTIELLERLSLVDFGDKRGIEILEEAIQFADQIRLIDTEGVDPLVSVLDMNVYLREDEVTEGNCCKEVMSNATLQEDEYFVAPLGNIPLVKKENNYLYETSTEIKS